MRRYILIVSFDVTADAYSRFMGRFSSPLAVLIADLADIRPGQRALDVGCGPGMLTEVLVERLGVAAVCAIDPSPPFVQAAAERFPGVDVHRGVAEDLPFPDDAFDATLASLVVHFMADPVAGLGEMARVTRPGGVVAATVWNHGAGGAGPLSTFWRAACELDPDVRDEADLAGSQQGQLAALCEAAGLRDIEATSLTVTCAFPTFADWWEPFTFGVGPAGDHVASLDEEHRESLRSLCERLLPAAPFEVAASAWAVRASAA